MKDLEEYNKKRNFNVTSEPHGNKKIFHKKLKFSIQYHIASKKHYDLRLEYNGVLESFAIPKGPSYNPNDKRLAIKVENHPYSYINFEGNIPPGEYGAGIVMLFDIGTYKIITKTDKLIKFILKGKRMKGAWSLVHFKNNNWLLIKDRDYYSNFINISKYKRSIKTNRTMQQIKDNVKLIKNGNSIVYYNKVTNLDKVVIDNYTKKDIIKYYDYVSKRMLPFLENRVISVIRASNNKENNIFYKKHLENNSNYLSKININRFSGKKDYYYILNKEDLISEVQMNSYEFHIWSSLASNINKPNIIIFDLDPDPKLDLNTLREGVKDLKNVLDNLKLKSYLKTSGGKGYHIVVPFKEKITWNKALLISKNIADLLVKKYPLKFTTNMSKKKRKKKIFIDYYRNTFSSTCVCPYSIRFRHNLPISMPISWHNLDNISPNQITIKNAKKYLKHNPWQNFFN